MRALLRDLAYLGLFAAAVAAIVLVVIMHQRGFTLRPAEAEPAPAPAVQLAAMPQSAPTPTRPEGDDLGTVADQPRLVEAALPATTLPFDPSTRGVAGDARVLCLPEVHWLQDQLSRWATEGSAGRRERPLSLSAAHAAARRASAFDYVVSRECWNDPGVVEARGWGDCADKSLWLARELLHAGYPMVGIRLGVPEDYAPGQPGHAWVVLYHHGGEWIYDPAASPRLTTQDAGPTKRFRITATVFPR